MLSLVHTTYLLPPFPPVPTEVLDYYLVCDESCISSPLNPSFFNSSRAFMAISQEEQTVREYINTNHTELQVYSPSSTTCIYQIANASFFFPTQPMLDTVVLQFFNAESAIANITVLSNCTGLNGDYLSALDSFCDNS